MRFRRAAVLSLVLPILLGLLTACAGSRYGGEDGGDDTIITMKPSESGFTIVEMAVNEYSIPRGQALMVGRFILRIGQEISPDTMQAIDERPGVRVDVIY